MSTSSHAAALPTLIYFLTKPLTQMQCPPTTIMTFHSLLNHAFAPYFAPDTHTFSCILSARFPPPVPIYTALKTCKLSWNAWAHRLCAAYNGHDVELSVTPQEMRVRPMGTTVAQKIWTKKSKTFLDVPKAPERRLPIVHAQQDGLVHSGHGDVPSLYVTPPSSPPGLFRRRALPTTPPAPEPAIEITVESPPDSESDSDSSYSDDTESSSSPTTSPESSTSDLPATALHSRSTPDLRLLRTERRRAVSPSNATATKYMYTGGVTNVVGGGVMLGGGVGVGRGATRPYASTPAPILPPSRSAHSAPAKFISTFSATRRSDCSSNWRQRT